MTRFVLTRHGETIWHAENRYAGSSDIELTDEGRLQAASLARWAAGAKLAAIWSSPLVRAKNTALPSGDASGLEVRVDARLREVAFGRGEGRTPAEMAREFPEAYAAFRADPVASPLPGGEDPAAAVRRGLECLGEIGPQFPDGRVLVVAHGTLIRLMLCELLSLPIGRYRHIFPVLSNATLTEIDLQGRAASVLSYNAPIAGA